MNNQFSAFIKSVFDEVKTKATGKQYVLATATINVIKDGVNIEKDVLAQYTLENEKGEAKPGLEIGQKVNLYHTIVPSTREGEKNQHFFEISRGVSVATNAELDELLGSEVTADVAKEAITA